MTEPNDDKYGLDWTDVELLALGWSDCKTKIWFDFLCPPCKEEPETKRKLIAEWISDLSINFGYRGHGSYPPLSWDATFLFSEDNTWKIEFEFPPIGKISFKCQDYAIE